MSTRSVVPFDKAQAAAAIPQERFKEIGSTGLKQFGGVLDEEFLRELRNRDGVKVFSEMGANDAVCGASLFAYTTLAREAASTVASARPGDRLADEIAEFVRGALYDDMNLSWRDLLGEIFSFLRYGWAWFEVVYKRRSGYVEPSDAPDAPASSKFSDNRIGWRKWGIRGQDTLWKWELDDHGGIRGMVQRAAPTYQTVTIPIGRSLLFRTRTERNNPEGASILRTAYLPWYFKRRIQIIRGIGIERDLAGLPVLTPPEGTDIWNPNDSKAVTLKATAEKIVRSIRRDEHEGIIKPHGWILELLASAGTRQFNITEVIGQLNAEIAMSMATDFLLVGHEKVGARSVSSDKREFFGHAADSFLDSIGDVINRFAIPELVRLNGWPPELAPVWRHDPVAEVPLRDLGEYIQRLAGAGVLFPDEALENRLRARAKMPPAPENRPPAAAQPEPGIEDTGEPDVEGED